MTRLEIRQKERLCLIEACYGIRNKEIGNSVYDF